MVTNNKKILVPVDNAIVITTTSNTTDPQAFISSGFLPEMY
jgi:hypothetical protein